MFALDSTQLIEQTRQALPTFLAQQRWVAGKGGTIERVEFDHYDLWVEQLEVDPSRRRAQHSPLRDVVGMLRLCDDAAHLALRQAAADCARAWAMLPLFLRKWEQQTQAAFLVSYAEAARDSPGYPAHSGQVEALLDGFALEKAGYELRYELDNRPDWVIIPLRGLCKVLSLETKDIPR